MPVTVVALTSVNETNLEDLTTYMAITAPLLEASGAKIVGQHEINKALVGPSGPNTITIVEYPDSEAVSHVFDSSEYGQLGEVRRRAFTYYQIFELNDERRRLVSLNDTDTDHMKAIFGG